VELRGEDLSYHLKKFNPLVNDNVRMIISFPTERISAISQWQTRWRRKPAACINMSQNYVTVMCICSKSLTMQTGQPNIDACTYSRPRITRPK